MEIGLTHRIRAGAGKDYLSLTKPGVVWLHILTAAAAMFLAARGIPPVKLLVGTLLGGALVAGAANVLNCYFDRDVDRLMERTRRRPLPAGRLKAGNALVYGLMLGFGGLVLVGWGAGWVAASLAAGAMIYYILIYTIWLKRRTYWSAVVGSGAGAFPPLIGWLAVSGRLEVTPLVLFIIIALWTPPHFWALALCRKQDYRDSGLAVLPPGQTTSWIKLFSIPLVAAACLVTLPAGLSLRYLVVAGVSGLVLIVLAIRAGKNNSTAHRLYRYSIVYLMLIFGSMLLDAVLA